MRTLSSPLQRPASAVSPAPASPPAAATAPHTSACSAPVPDIVPPTSSTPQHPTSEISPTLEILAENAELKAEVAKLREEVKVILDHSIESDQRLLEFTDAIFTTPKSLTPQKKSEITISVNASAQTDKLPEDSEKKLVEFMKRVVELEEEIEVLKRPCRKCVTLREETKKMIDSIRCLEEENKVLGKNGVATLLTKDKTSSSISISNSYEALGGLSEESENDKFIRVEKKKKRSKKKKQKAERKSILPTLNSQQKINTYPKKDTKQETLKAIPITSVSFSTVTIEGDSHARFLAGLVQPLVTAETAVLGVCKPGAGLLGVVEGSRPPPPGSCSVLIAGANDIGAGESSAIYKHLEQQIIQRTRTGKVVVSTVPHRYDLPADHPVNQQTTLVNNYIRELCARYKASVLLDFNTIGRRYFTRHGQHLTMGGKRLLAGLLVAGLREVNVATVPPTPPSPSPRQSPSSVTVDESPGTVAAEPPCLPLPSTEPAADAAVSSVPHGPETLWTLPHNSYAEAVKSPTPIDLQNERYTDTVHPETKSVFLGTPP